MIRYTCVYIPYAIYLCFIIIFYWFFFLSKILCGIKVYSNILLVEIRWILNMHVYIWYAYIIWYIYIYILCDVWHCEWITCSQHRSICQRSRRKAGGMTGKYTPVIIFRYTCVIVFMQVYHEIYLHSYVS